MTRPIRMRVRLDGDLAEIRALIDHPMETGLRKDSKTGELVPLHFIQNLTVSLNGKPVLETQWGQAIARNPYIQLRVRGARVDDEVSIEWLDNQGERGRASAKVPPPG